MQNMENAGYITSFADNLMAFIYLCKTPQIHNTPDEYNAEN